MNVNAIKHDPIVGCYAYDSKTLIVKLETGKEVTCVNLYANDPYVASFGKPWQGKRLSMRRLSELKHSLVWAVEVVPEYKRLQYYFEVEGDGERIYLFDDGLHADLNDLDGRIVQYFKYAWLNPSDVCTVPKWAEDVVWYQIFPDRFNRAEGVKCSLDILEWGDECRAKYDSFYGGNIRGITEKLDYIKSLGISGLYLTPIMLSDTNHRYNTHDYTLVDPNIGSQSDLKELIQKAHGMGLKIMLDAVFNHCGTQFFAWRDVVENGKKSKYYDWFFINDDSFAKRNGNTVDGRYYSFAFVAGMPKLNTNNPKVMDYLINICKDWVNLGVDGIRFDVGNEVSHAFLKKLRLELKALNPELFILGEIWHRALPWLLGDEYDSIMNFQFLECVNDFYVDNRKTSRELAYAINENYNNYYKQINGVLFNMLDNHDVDRAFTRCKSIDALLQELTILMTMPGSPSIYYGTETAIEGEVRESRNRRCMPWRDIDGGKYDEILSEFRKIVALRKTFAEFKHGEIEWNVGGNRIVDYTWTSGKRRMQIVINATDSALPLSADGKILYSRKLDGNTLLPGGIVVAYR